MLSCEEEDQQEQRAVDGVDDHADEQEGQRFEPAAALGEEKDDAQRGDATDEGGGLLRDVRQVQGCEARRGPDEDRQRCAAADAQEVWLGQGIAEDGLIGDAGQGERCADQRGDQRCLLR